LLLKLSLPPQRKPIDLNKFTNAYIANLNAQIANDSKVYNAVMANLTGQAPPAAPTDTRPIEEKLLDREKLMLELRQVLPSLTDPNNIQMIMAELGQPDQSYRLQMAVQSFPALYDALKSKYKIGVPAIVFLSALDRMIQSQDITSGVSIGLQETTGQDILLGIQELKNLPRAEDYNDLLDSLDNTDADSELMDNIERIRDSMLTEENLRRLEEEENATGVPYTQAASNVLENQITRGRLMYYLNRLTGEENPEAVLNELQDELPNNSSIQEMGDLKDVAERPSLSKQSSESTVLPFERYMQPANPTTYTGRSQPAPRFAPPQESQETQDLYAGQMGEMGGYGLRRKKIMRGKGLVSNHSATTSREKKQKIRLKLEGVIEKPKSYFPFGRYALNRNKLEQGILMVRSASGAVVPKLATQKISKNICDILKVILSNSVPTYESINALVDTDKDILHKILKEAHIHHISTPSPNISKQEADYRRFTVLKGELMAGQNSPIAIKELKRLIIKLMSQDLLPKREATQALVELAMMESI